MKGTCLWAALCQTYNRVVLALPLNSLGVDTQCETTHTCTLIHTCLDTRGAGTSSSITQDERYWRDLQPNGTKFPQCCFMGLWISGLNGPSASQSLRHPYASIWMGHLLTQTHTHTRAHKPQPASDNPGDIALFVESCYIFITHSHMDEVQGHLFVIWAWIHI